MIKGHTISLCLPCRNESTHLGQLLNDIPDCVDEIIVVVNASTDDSAAIARRVDGRITVIEDNRTVDDIGYGYALMTATAAATSDIIICADSDGTYPIEQAADIANQLLVQRLDFISCSRYPVLPGSTTGLLSRCGATLFNWQVRLLLGVKLQDSLSGMWVFRAAILDQLELSEGGWNFSLQIKLNAATNPVLEVAEYPITQHARYGTSKQDYIKTGLQHLRFITNYRRAMLNYDRRSVRAVDAR